MSRSATPGIVALAATCAVALAACGTNLPREEFVTRADEACTVATQRPELPRLGGAPLGAAEQGALLRKEKLQLLQEELKGIVPPRDLTREYGDLLIHVGDAVEQLEELEDAARGEDARRALRLRRELAETADAAARAARAAQVGACGVAVGQVIA